MHDIQSQLNAPDLGLTTALDDPARSANTPCRASARC